MSKTIRELTNAPTLPELCADVGIESTYIGRSKWNDADKYERDDWLVTLTYQGRTFADIEFHMGTGHSPERLINSPGMMLHGKEKTGWKATPPTAADVLSSLILDSSARNELFPDWCAGLGYDSDSIKANDIYNKCIATGIQTVALLGDDFARFETAAQDY